MYPWWALPSSKARKGNEYLAVLATLALDSPRRNLRDAQRDTFLRYKGAATRRNGFRDKILFLYAMGAHHSTTESLQVTDYRDATVVSGGDESLRSVTPPTELRTSSFAVEESLKHLDVMWMINFTDLRPTSKKKLGERISWGVDAEVCMTTKLISFLFYATYQFPGTPFIGEADDDAFLKVPQIIIELENMQTEMLLFNQNSEHYRVKHGYWGALLHDAIPGVTFLEGYLSIVSRSLLQIVIGETTDLVKNVETPTVLKYHDNMSPRDTILMGIVLALSPFRYEYYKLYVANLVEFEDRLFGALVYAVNNHLLDNSCRAGKDLCELVYYRVESPCRAHYMWKAPPKNFIHRRNSVVVHRTITPILDYRVFLYMSNPAGLFNHSDSATAEFIQELRWDEDDAYDKINFAALEQSPLWEELFPADPARREAVLDKGAPWWDDTHIKQKFTFQLGVSRHPFVSKNATQKQHLHPISSAVGDFSFACGLPSVELRCGK
ncbi:hypothetical protein, conserved [Angomonas deanei]|uniref:Hexosyltransferase n=1 Tax=Angomonas deanei TaxID=59799 RepID=A0A7G2CNI2_9TRYP|nr:hypothetical protein, conserved [Angomonas deanei]